MRLVIWLKYPFYKVILSLSIFREDKLKSKDAICVQNNVVSKESVGYIFTINIVEIAICVNNIDLFLLELLM